MAGDNPLDIGAEQTDPHPRIKDPVEHHQRNILRVVVWGVVALVAIALVASFASAPLHIGMDTPTHV